MRRFGVRANRNGCLFQTDPLPNFGTRAMTSDVCYFGRFGVQSRHRADIDTVVVVDSLKALDPGRPIREADIRRCYRHAC